MSKSCETCHYDPDQESVDLNRDSSTCFNGVGTYCKDQNYFLWKLKDKRCYSCTYDYRITGDTNACDNCNDCFLFKPEE